jgi:hypothetical protein
MRSHVRVAQLPTTVKHIAHGMHCHNNLGEESLDVAHGLKCGRDHGAVVDMAELLWLPPLTAYR